MEFKCKKCNRIFIRKSAYTAHIQRKTSCLKRVKVHSNNASAQNCTSSTPDSLESKRKTVKQYKCYNCKKVFTRNSSLKRHLGSETCFTENQLSQIDDLMSQFENFKGQQKENEEKLIEMQKRIDNLEKENNKLKSKAGDTINNINTDNSTTNIDNSKNMIMINYDITNQRIIDDEKLLLCMRQGFQSPVHLTKAVHFDEDHPEYHNVFISGMKSRYAMIYRNDNWELVLKEDIIDKIYDDNRNYIEDNMEKFYDRMTVSQKRALHRWLDIEDEGDDRITRIKESIRLLLYNDRRIPEKTKKLLEM